MVWLHKTTVVNLFPNKFTEVKALDALSRSGILAVGSRVHEIDVTAYIITFFSVGHREGHSRIAQAVRFAPFLARICVLRAHLLCTDLRCVNSRRQHNILADSQNCKLTPKVGLSIQSYPRVMVILMKLTTDKLSKYMPWICKKKSKHT